MSGPAAGPVSGDGSSTDEAALLPFERLLTDISARFISLPAEEIDAAIRDALGRIGRLLDMDRVNLHRLDEDGRTELTHSWARTSAHLSRRHDISAKYPWILGRIRAGLPVVVPRVADMPPEASRDHAELDKVGPVKSHVSMPLRVGHRIEGALSFGTIERERDWSPAFVERVAALAMIFGNALAHKRAVEALDDTLAFERTISSVQAVLLESRLDDHQRGIERALEMLGRALYVQRATLWRRSEGTGSFEATHGWRAEGFGHAPAQGDMIPWLVERVARGLPVRYGRAYPASPEERRDLDALAMAGVRSGVVVPLSATGTVVGALSFASHDAERRWPDALLDRMAFVGGVFTALIEREAAERREHEAQAQAIHAARVSSMGMFAASLVHELSQPLAASLANAETAVELVGPSSRQQELRATLSDLVADNRRAAEQVQQLRRVLRRGENERGPVEAADIVREAVRIVEPIATGKRIDIRAGIGEGLGQIVANRVQVQQVLINLLVNALDSAAGKHQSEARVAIDARATPAGIVIEVSDNGPGIDAQSQSRIFEPFFTTKASGMGLGLSISRTIASAHGGKLSVHSRAGEGATFRLELPQLPAEGKPRETILESGGGPGGTVFVIEDDDSMRRAIERQLGSAGYRVVSYASADAFLAAAPVEGRACIVSDVRMPGSSGLDLQDVLSRRASVLPIVFISGQGDVPTTVEAMKGGAVGFLPKPFSRGDLLKLVDEALARSDRLREGEDARVELESRYAKLTPREREVFDLVSQGLLNKVVADRLGTTEATVKVHRGRVMDKLGARSVADLVRMAERLDGRSRDGVREHRVSPKS